MLGAAEAQVYAPGKTGFREYQPYSTDPTKYFAGPSGLQQSTYGEAAGMQTPGQFAPATGMAGLAGLGQLGAGGAYQQMATSPGAIGAYMSPFAQNVMDVQKQAAMREAQIGNVGNKLAAARQGTYGGARETLGRLEREKNLQSRLGEIQATGSQAAYDRAMQNMQYGSNLGLQGLAGASQTAGTLAGIGGQQQQADIARLGLQNQLGQQQQQYQQGIINQAIQDYATQQQYPFMQLSTMSNLLRGLPMQGMTTQQYQAAPSAISQLGGLGATALGAYGAAGGFKAAEGGQVKSYAGGGSIKGYAGPEGSLVGGEGATGVAGSIERQLMGKEIPELVQIARTNPSEQIREMAGRIAAAKQSQQKEAQSMGLASAPAGNLDDIGMAGGGIVAFARGDLVNGLTDEEQEAIGKDETLQRINLMNKYFTGQGMGQQSPEAKAIGENIADIRKGLGSDYDSKNFFRAMMKGGTKAMQSTSPYAMVGLGAGLEGGVDEYTKGEARKEDLMSKLRTGEIDLAKLSSTERNNLFRNITSAISADEATKGRLEASKHSTALRNIEAGKREDARTEAAKQRDETQIREWTKIFLGTVNQQPTADQIAAARKQAEDYVRNTKVIKIPD
jgi:hypothetical protein